MRHFHLLSISKISLALLNKKLKDRASSYLCENWAKSPVHSRKVAWLYYNPLKMKENMHSCSEFRLIHNLGSVFTIHCLKEDSSFSIGQMLSPQTDPEHMCISRCFQLQIWKVMKRNGTILLSCFSSEGPKGKTPLVLGCSAEPNC